MGQEAVLHHDSAGTGEDLSVPHHAGRLCWRPALQQSGETSPASASVERQKAAASLSQAVFPCQGLEQYHGESQLAGSGESRLTRYCFPGP